MAMQMDTHTNYMNPRVPPILSYLMHICKKVLIN